MDHFTYGLLTPVLAYVMAATGGALGLRCTVRAITSTGVSRRKWLVLAAVTIGSGIWTMHFVAMMGFSVAGTAIRYDVMLTIASWIVAMVVVGGGVFIVGYGQSVTRALILGGIGTGLGVAAMHYIGMSAMRLHGTVGYDLALVLLSVGIAIGAATAALWAALRVHGITGAIIAALAMGLAVTSMHYTGMAALRIELMTGETVLTGVSSMEFLFPLVVILGSFLFLTSAFVSLSPTAKEQAASATAERLRRAEMAARSTVE
jgi:NO-binding membrane sensor protein with MHYT domain